MNRKGELSSGVIITLIIAAVLLVAIVVASTDKFGSIGSFFNNFIPGYNSSANPLTENVVSVGIDLSNDLRLVYFSGNAWIPLKTTNNVASIGSYDIPSSLREQLIDFYFNTDRKSANFFELPEPWRILHAVPLAGKTSLFYHSQGTPVSIEGLGNAAFADKGTYVYALDELASNELGTYKTRIFVNSNDELYVLHSAPFRIEKATSDELKRYTPYISKLSSWRDQLLENGQCEKFVSVSFTKDKSPMQEAYRVKQLKNYIYIDFNMPVQGTEEKFVSCVKQVDPYPIRFSDASDVSIHFSINGAPHVYSWNAGKDEWTYTGDHASDFYIFQGSETNHFYDGLMLATRKLDGKYAGILGTGYWGKKPVLDSITFEFKGKPNIISIQTLQQSGALDANGQIMNTDLFVDGIMTKYYELGNDFRMYENAAQEREALLKKDFSLFSREVVNTDITRLYYSGIYTGLYVKRMSSFEGSKYFLVFETTSGTITTRSAGTVENGIILRNNLISEPPEEPFTWDVLGELYVLNGKKLNDIPLRNT